MLTTSGSCGPWLRSPAAKPAKAAPSCFISSAWVAGTTLAFGAPLNSTKEHKKNSIPFSSTCGRSSICFSFTIEKHSQKRLTATKAGTTSQSDFSALASIHSIDPIFLSGHSRCGLLSHKLSGLEARRRERSDQLRCFTCGNEFGYTFSSDRGRLETVGPPTNIHVEIRHLRRHADDGSKIRRHVTHAGPLAQHAKAVQVREEFQSVGCHLLERGKSTLHAIRLIRINFCTDHQFSFVG